MSTLTLIHLVAECWTLADVVSFHGWTCESSSPGYSLTLKSCAAIGGSLASYLPAWKTFQMHDSVKEMLDALPSRAVGMLNP